MNHPLQRFPVGALAIALAASVLQPEMIACTESELHSSFAEVPAGILEQPDEIPAHWLTTPVEICSFLDTRVERGVVDVVGTTAGGRPIRSVSYGSPRTGRGTSTLTGALGFGDVSAYLGPDAGKRVYMAIGGVHGAEFEGIVGLINLVSVLETGRDLRNREWPGIVEAASRIDRIVIVPIVNVDGRARVPLRMQIYRGVDNRAHRYLNLGALKDGEPLGFPAVKQWTPVDFAGMQFPGGYPNDAGVNLQHDDFFGNPQPETKALYNLLARERPDIVYNVHTGSPPDNDFLRIFRVVMEPALEPVFDDFYRTVHTALARAGLQKTGDPDIEGDPALAPRLLANLDTALNLHCGALPILTESPCHGFSRQMKDHPPVRHTADSLLDAQLVSYEAGMKFLADRGGRAFWFSGRGK